MLMNVDVLCPQCSLVAFGCEAAVDGRGSFVSLLSLFSFVSFLRPYLAENWVPQLRKTLNNCALKLGPLQDFRLKMI